MPPAERNYGLIAAITGVAALLLAAYWYWRNWSDGQAFPPVPPDDIAALYGFWLLAVAFEFGVPLLCLVTGLLGVPARRETTSKLGLACALLALLLYAAYLRSCSLALSQASNRYPISRIV